MIGYVERKQPDMRHVQRLLDACAAENRWANGGPLWHRLAEEMAAHMGLPAGRRLMPCANAGLAVEALARLIAQRAGRRLRWAMPAFAFRNLGRGYFAEGLVVDCDADGLLDPAALEAAPPDSFDGIVAVNPLGHARDLSPLFALARRRGLPLILDNAAGIGARVPDWDWQAFSLHHTKPYGMGEGGLALVPDEAAADFAALTGYGPCPEPPGAWLNNAKLSDIACAFHLDRLARAGEWRAAYAAQRARVARLAAGLGLTPLSAGGEAAVPVTGLALLAPHPVPEAGLAAMRHIVALKYYQPIAPRPRAADLYARVLCLPAHPDLAGLSDDAIAADIDAALRAGRA
jgi:dTDP-4-amino-4,6-dideoxygalactose transaminase